MILSHIDFSKNYRFEPQNKIQVEYYHSVNVTILVHIIHQVQVCPKTNEKKVVKESHFYNSDDHNHDTLFVQYCLTQHWKWLDAQGINPSEHIVFSNGVGYNLRIDEVCITWQGIWELQRVVECSGNTLAQRMGKVTPTFISGTVALLDSGIVFFFGLLIFFIVLCLLKIVLPIIRRVGWSRCGSEEQAPSRATMQ